MLCKWVYILFYRKKMRTNEEFYRASKTTLMSKTLLVEQHNGKNNVGSDISGQKSDREAEG